MNKDGYFTKKIDKRSRDSMEEYLASHFRYYTMNPWNRSQSYAHNVKIYNLGLPEDIIEKAWDVIETEDFYLYHINTLIEEFDEEMDFRYQAGFNGRSGGYVVLYQGGYEEKPYFRQTWNSNNYYCDSQNRSYSKKEAENHPRFGETYKKVYTKPGLGMDEDKDYSELSMDELRNTVELVQRFDLLVEEMRDVLLELCRTTDVETEEYYVTKKRRVLVDK